MKRLEREKERLSRDLHRAELLLVLLGYVLFANYLALCVVFTLWVGAVYLIVLFEERELRDHFGEAYAEYARFVPRWR